MTTQQPAVEDNDGAQTGAMEVNVIFAEFLGINNLLFNRGGRSWLPVPKSVRAMRYAAHATMLDNLAERLRVIIEGLSVELRRERAMRRYASMLLEAILCLSKICTKLSLRTKRPKGQYDDRQYQQDLKEYHVLVENYRVESAKINRFLARTPR